MKPQTKPVREKPVNKERWLDLVELCTRMHSLLYLQNDPISALPLLPELKKALRTIPSDTEGIYYHEGMAIACEIEGKVAKAVLWRQREIAGMVRLNKTIKESRRLTPPQKRSILQRRGTSSLRFRKKILARLIEESELA
jgi:hypothetical protein